MDNISVTAVRGLQSRMQSLDLLASNLVNSATSGYKIYRELSGIYSSEDSQNAVDGGPGAMLPAIEKQWTDFSQGVIEVTGNLLDVALSGKGFFGLNGPNGPPYTHNESFQLLPSREIGTGDGMPLRGVGGNTIRVSSNKSLTVSADGVVHQDVASLGQIQIVAFKSTDSFRKTTSTAFQDTDSRNNSPIPAPDAKIPGRRVLCQ
jgi:flagellar basal-body rod protein FlgF